MKRALLLAVAFSSPIAAAAQSQGVRPNPAGQIIMYRADASHTGVYPESKAPKGKLKWSFATGHKIRSTAALYNGEVYFGSNDGFLYALDAVSGKLKWKFKAAGPVSSSPAIYKDTVFIEAGDAAFHAVDASTGRAKWTVKTGPPIPADPKLMSSGKWEFEHASPVIAGDTVYFGSADGSLYALDPATGHEKWKCKTGSRIRAAAAVADGVVYLPSMDGNLYALDSATGTQKWKFKTAGNQYFPLGEVQSSPAVGDGLVYFGSRDSGLYALKTADGTLAWKKDMENASWVIGGPALYQGMVIIGTSDEQNIKAYDAKTGELKWKAVSPSPANFLASPIIAGSNVYLGDFYGTMLWLDAATGKLRGAFITEGRIVASAVVKDGVLYFGGEDEVFYAVE